MSKVNGMIKMLREARDKAHDYEEGVDFHWDCLNNRRHFSDETISMSDLEKMSVHFGTIQRKLQEMIDELCALKAEVDEQ